MRAYSDNFLSRYADDNLNRVAAELDSFDGRKDPERCAALVSRLRSCQDKLLNICNRLVIKMIGAEKAINQGYKLWKLRSCIVFLEPIDLDRQTKLSE